MQHSSDYPTQQAVVAPIVEYGQPARMIALLDELVVSPKGGVEVLHPELPGARRLRATPRRFGAIYQVVDGRIRVWAAGPDDRAVLRRARAAIDAARADIRLIQVAVAAELAADADRDPAIAEAIAEDIAATERDAVAAEDDVLEDPVGNLLIIPFPMPGYGVLALIAAAVFVDGDWRLLQHDEAQVHARKARINRQLALVDRAVAGLNLL